MGLPPSERLVVFLSRLTIQPNRGSILPSPKGGGLGSFRVGTVIAVGCWVGVLHPPSGPSHTSSGRQKPQYFSTFWFPYISVHTHFLNQAQEPRPGGWDRRTTSRSLVGSLELFLSLQLVRPIWQAIWSYGVGIWPTFFLLF